MLGGVCSFVSGVSERLDTRARGQEEGRSLVSC